jgi:type IV pilus assembly protein PilX
MLPNQTRRENQTGISLIMVMLILMMVALTAVSASKSSLFNESITANEADYNRTLAAAEAMIRDGQLDLLATCAPASPCRRPPGVDVMSTAAQPFLPDNFPEYRELVTALAAAPNNCVNGLCAPADFTTSALTPGFWINPATLAAAKLYGATYGQFTGAAPVAAGNPILTAPGATGGRKAWYWIEVVLFDTSSCVDTDVTGGVCYHAPIDKKPFMYRISAVAEGNKPGTVAGIQTLFVPEPR